MNDWINIYSWYLCFDLWFERTKKDMLDDNTHILCHHQCIYAFDLFFYSSLLLYLWFSVSLEHFIFKNHKLSSAVHSVVPLPKKKNTHTYRLGVMWKRRVWERQSATMSRTSGAYRCLYIHTVAAASATHSLPHWHFWKMRCSTYIFYM